MPVLPTLSVRQKLLAIAIVAEGFTAAVSLSAVLGFERLSAASHAVREVEAARLAYQDADMQHDAIRGDVYRAALAETPEERAAVQDALRQDADRLRADLEAAAQVPHPALAAAVGAARPELEAFARLALEQARDVTPGSPGMRELEARFEATRVSNDRVIAEISAGAEARADDERRARRSAMVQIVVAGVGSMIGVIAITHLLARSIVYQLAGLAGVARRVMEGDLAARARVTGDDDIARLGQAFDGMADSLTEALGRVELEAHRDQFRAQLVEALDMVDEEEDALSIVRRAMVEVDRSTPIELLLSDSSRAHLRRVAESPTAGAPGCGVQSPFGCVAVRRGHAVAFPDSAALNACPQLHGRAATSIAAVCVPITFMGRALGVMHAAGPAALAPDQAQRLSTLAAHSGARIGTVRAFQKTQLQASTDGLTGLINRRTLENEVRGLIQRRSTFAIAMADLDRFKLLNDTYGHEAGDRALRTFSRVARSVIRPTDVAARLGGEEFVIVLRDLDLAAAEGVLERLRTALAQAEEAGHPRFTASFGLTHSTHADTFERLLAIADAALYRAKGQGRDRVVVGDPSDGGHAAPSSPPSNQTSGAGLLVLRRPALHEAADEEEPRPSGVEIR